LYKDIKISNLMFLDDTSKKYLKPFQILILPTIFLANSQGKLENIYIDYNTKNKVRLLKDLSKLLNQDLI